MSVSGISSSNLFNYFTQKIQNNTKQFQQEVQQLGQDLQAGNLSAAQSDFATLEQILPQNISTYSVSGDNSIAQALNQLSQDLQAGNLSAAQKDYQTIQQNFQIQGAQMHGHHNHRGGFASSAITRLFNQLGQALESGNLATAQQVFSSLQQVFQQSSQSGGSSSAQTYSQPTSTRLSVNA